MPGNAARLLAQLDPRLAAQGLLEQLDSLPARRSFVDLIPLFYAVSVLERVGHPTAPEATASLTMSPIAPYLSMMESVDLARRASLASGTDSLGDLMGPGADGTRRDRRRRGRARTRGRLTVSLGEPRGCLSAAGVVGRPRLKNSAISASTARTDSDARSPSRRASAFSSTMASPSPAGTPASSSAASRSASEMNGTPLVSSVCAFDERSSGTSGLLSMPVRNDAVSAEISTAPASAVPIEMPRFDDGVLQAADLAALLVGHRRDGHGTELRRQRADAETGEQHRPGDDLRPGTGVERGDEHDEAEEQREEPELADPPRRRLREHLGDPDRGDHAA